ncbi:MAG: hypothetical protein H6719_18865 [Sandaracinaceae bacterium]|nr:hypothetical protein [Sandaracinaceae bacterium]
MRSIQALLATSLLFGCVQQLPAPATPSRELPPGLADEARRATPPAGRGVVALDVDGEPATVEDLGAAPDAAQGESVCRTPCVATLPLGERPVLFRRGDRADRVTLHVGETPTAHRRTLSLDTGERVEYRALAIVGLTLGGLLTPILEPIASIDGANMHETDVALIAAGALSGAILTAGVVGLVLAIVDPQQLRDGASIELDLGP